MIQLGFDAAVIVASIWIATLVGHAPLSDGVVDGAGVALFAATSCTLLFLQRRALLALHERRYESGARRERLIFAGAPSRRMHEALRAAGQRRFAPEVIGWLEAAPASAQSTSLVPADTLSLARLGSLDELPRVLQEHPVDHVMFFAPVHDPVRARAALDTCNSQRVVATFVADPQQVGEHGPASFGSLAASRNALAVKDALDPLLAALAIVACSPLLAGIALAVWVSMGWPILFVQVRGGLFGRPFRMLKFRSMRVGAESERDELEVHNDMSGPVFKMREDPRITPFGRLLRASSLDELPQLFNVLTGTMSMVGPRPLPVHEQAQIHGWQRKRLSMKPGLTCLWQIGGRSDVDFTDWMLLDLRYIEEWSLGLDLKILLKTIPYVLLGRGAR